MKKVAVTLHTKEYRGDHDAEVTIAYELAEGETVEALADRLLHRKVRPSDREFSPVYTDWIEVRLVREED